MSVAKHAHLPRLTHLLVLPNSVGRDISEENIPMKQNTNGKQDLQFVNLPNNLKLDVAARKRVRSHVARDFRRRVKVPGSSSLDVDLTIAKFVTRNGVLGQKHRFRFSRQGLQETGKQSKRISANRKVSSVSQDSILSKPPIIRGANAVEDSGGTGMPSFPSLQTPTATEESIPSLSVDTSYSSNSMWDKSNAASSQSNTTSQCCTTPQRGSDSLGSSQLVCRAKSGNDHSYVQKLHLATTGMGNLDPFNTMPVIDSSYRTQTLMHHCKHSVSLAHVTPLVVLMTCVHKTSPSTGHGLAVDDESTKRMVLVSDTRSRAFSCRSLPCSWEP